jgi:UDP-glucuronate 4-epimerase
VRPWLVTGAAGFIGFHLSRRLLSGGRPVVGVDDLSETYDPALKKARLELLLADSRFDFRQVDVRDAGTFDRIVAEVRPAVVVHLAARAGVRASTRDPLTYVDVNVTGTVAVLEACRRHRVGHLVYASSSSVYGAHDEPPFAVARPADHPVSVYAATKRATELLAHATADLHGLPTTGLRFFTVYGSWGRPDMAYYDFADAILTGRPITVFGDGTAPRDLTHVDDVVEVMIRAAARPPARGAAVTPGTSPAPWRLLNVGLGQRVTVNQLVARLEALLGRRAIRVEGPPQPGDVPATQAEVEALAAIVDYRPRVTVDQGLRGFTDWLVGHRS